MRIKTPARFNFCGPVASIAIFAANPALALDVPFTAQIDNPDACEIVVLEGGTMVANAADTQLSSYASGAPARALVTSYWFGYDLRAYHSQVWNVSPIANNQDTSFQPFISGTSTRIFGGANLGSFSDVPDGQAVQMPFLSETEVSVNLIAQHNSGSFPGGVYATNVTLICD
ncbi:MAG: hypothetical protein AAF940_15185 [Pseudomonadota bacterium]